MGADLYPGGESRSAAPALVSLVGVTKRWGEYTALRDVDLVVQPGEVVGIAGGNGVGKTTLLRTIAGVLIPDSGRVDFLGVDIRIDPPSYERALGFLSAGNSGLYARLTVSQNLDFWGGLAGLSRRERRWAMKKVISDFDLGALAERRVDRLSMGQRQRVRLAMTFLHDPLFLVLDEPETSLDGEGIALLTEAVATLAADGGGALIAAPELPSSVTGSSWWLEDGLLRPLSGERSIPAERGGEELLVPLGEGT